jgi:hypothetical protein
MLRRETLISKSFAGVTSNNVSYLSGFDSDKDEDDDEKVATYKENIIRSIIEEPEEEPIEGKSDKASEKDSKSEISEDQNFNSDSEKEEKNPYRQSDIN